MSSGSSLLSRVLGAMEEPPGVRELVAAAISEESGEVIRPGYSRELDEAREFRDGAHEWLTRFEAEERLKTGLKTLKVGYRDGEGYFIEVAGKETSAVPDLYQHRKALKTTPVRNGELKEHDRGCSGPARRSSASSGASSRDTRPPSRRRARTAEGSRAIAVVDVVAPSPLRRRATLLPPRVAKGRGIRISGGSIRRRHNLETPLSQRLRVEGTRGSRSSQAQHGCKSSTSAGASSPAARQALTSLRRASLGVIDRSSRGWRGGQVASGESTLWWR